MIHYNSIYDCMSVHVSTNLPSAQALKRWQIRGPQEATRNTMIGCAVRKTDGILLIQKSRRGLSGSLVPQHSLRAMLRIIDVLP
jgi:hypothetical protein